MLADAEKYREEDERQKEKITARNSLESYIFGCKQAVEDCQTGAVTDADKQTVKDKCTSTMSWLDANNLAEKDEFEHKLKELQQVCARARARVAKHKTIIAFGPFDLWHFFPLSFHQGVRSNYGQNAWWRWPAIIIASCRTNSWTNSRRSWLSGFISIQKSMQKKIMFP